MMIKLFALLALTLPASAAVKFVNGGASGANNGTSWANGWTNTSSIGWSGLSPGDTVCMAGGTYSGSITTAKSGTSGNPITLKRATASDPFCGFSTVGWSGAFDAQVIIPGITYAGFNFITLQGAVANGIKMTVPNSSGDPSAVGVIAANDSIIIDNVEIAGPCGTSACNQNGDSRAIDMSVFLSGNFALQSNWIIRNSNLHGQCTILITTKSSNLLIEHTRFADSADSTPGNPNCHPNVLEAQDATNFTFRYNEVTNWQVEGILLCSNGACFQNVDMYGNLWHDPMGGSFPRVMEVQGPGASGPDHAYNNTFINIPFSTFGTANSGSYSAGSAGLNNIYISSASSGLPSNDYDAFNGSTGGETHGQNISTSIFTNFAAHDYTLATNTATGTSLPLPFNIDLNGTVRGVNGIWDRGYFQIPTTSTTYFIRPGGGVRVGANVCNGKFDVDYSVGVAPNCAFNDFRLMWSPNDGSGTTGTWLMAGGDTVVIRGCHAGAGQVNPADPDCRLGYDNPTNGNPPNSWCPSIGPYDCRNPPIPAGTASQHTRILGGCVGAGNCNTGNTTNRANLTQLFAGFGLTWAFNLSSTQYVDIQGIELTTHNGACSHHGAPPWPRECSTSPPLDDYSDNGFLTNNATSNILYQDIYVHGFESNGGNGPIGGPITFTRVNSSFNAQSGWQFDDGSDTPDAPGSQVLGSYVTMIGNGCKEQYPIVNAFPALACWDSSSGGFGDAWSGQDTILDRFDCDHCTYMWNTKDADVGPHTQVASLTRTSNYYYGNMGAQIKLNNAVGATQLFQNNLIVGNCYRMSQPIPGAAQNFVLSSGLGGSYLSNFCRASGATVANPMRSASTISYIGNTFVTAGPIVFEYGCGFYSPGNVFNPETNCNTSILTIKGNNFLGYSDPIIGAQVGLYSFDDPSAALALVSSYNNEFNVRNGDLCNVNHILCLDPLLLNEPTLPWPGSEAALDVFNASVVGNSFNPTSISPLRAAGIFVAGLLADYYGTPRPNPPGLGGVEFVGSSPTLVSMTVTPNPASVTTTTTVALNCTAIYSDSSTAPCTSPIWTSTATHSTINSSTGVVTGTTIGSDTATATIGSIHGSATVNITGPPPPSMTVTGAFSVTGSVTKTP